MSIDELIHTLSEIENLKKLKQETDKNAKLQDILAQMNQIQVSLSSENLIPSKESLAELSLKVQEAQSFLSEQRTIQNQISTLGEKKEKLSLKKEDFKDEYWMGKNFLYATSVGVAICTILIVVLFVASPMGYGLIGIGALSYGLIGIGGLLVCWALMAAYQIGVRIKLAQFDKQIQEVEKEKKELESIKNNPQNVNDKIKELEDGIQQLKEKLKRKQKMLKKEESWDAMRALIVGMIGGCGAYLSALAIGANMFGIAAIASLGPGAIVIGAGLALLGTYLLFYRFIYKIKTFDSRINNLNEQIKELTLDISTLEMSLGIRQNYSVCHQLEEIKEQIKTIQENPNSEKVESESQTKSPSPVQATAKSPSDTPTVITSILNTSDQHDPTPPLQPTPFESRPYDTIEMQELGKGDSLLTSVRYLFYSAPDEQALNNNAQDNVARSESSTAPDPDNFDPYTAIGHKNDL